MKSITPRRWLASSALLSLLVAALPLHGAGNAIERMLRRTDPSIGAAERKAFEDQVEKHPAQLEVWLAYCEYSFGADQPAETLELLKRATTRIPMAPELWRLQAEVYRLDAESGPEWYTRPGVTSGRNPPSPLGDKEFRQQSLEGMVAALDRVLALRADPEAGERRGEALLGLERWEEAAAAFARLTDAGQAAAPRLAAKRSYGLFMAGRADEARAAVAAALGTHPRSADLHYVRSRMLRDTDAEAAAEAERQGDFYGRLLPGSSLDYTPERAASLERMFGRKEGTSGLFAGDRLNEQIEAEIDALRQRGDEEARELLAALAWSHSAHGELEDKAFASLGDHGDVDRLNRIYENAGSPCTLGGSLRELTRLRAPGTFERLVEHLPGDGGFFPIGVVSLLVKLGDPRAAQPLIGYSRDRDVDLFEPALVALGWFDGPETRRHLEYWTKDAEARPFAAAALYRITREEKWMKPLQKLRKPDHLYDLGVVTRALRDIDTPSAKKLVARYDELRAKEEAKRQAKRKQ